MADCECDQIRARSEHRRKILKRRGSKEIKEDKQAMKFMAQDMARNINFVDLCRKYIREVSNDV